MDIGTDTNMWLIFLYTVQLVISDVCTKFQNSRSSSSGEIFDENFHMHFLRVRDGKRKKKEEKIEKEGKIKSQHLSFVNSNTLGCPHCVYEI